MEEFNSHLINISTLFGDSQVLYRVPLLQRKFVWDEEDVRELLTDIHDTMNFSRDSRYFIGGMVFSKNEGGRLVVIDGQQRISTLALIMSASRDIFKKRGNTEQSSFYKARIGTSSLDEQGEPKMQYFVELQKRDNPTFVKLLENKKITKKELSVSERNLISAKDCINEYLLEYVDKGDLGKFMHYILERVYVVRTIAADQSTAFQIFETLNDRGARLQPEDLLKNLLLQRMNDDEYDEFSERWNRFTNNLIRDGKYVVRIPAFLKHFIMSKGDYINKGEIFDWFKEKDFTHDQVIELQDILEISSKKYREFAEGKGNASIEALKKLKFKQGNIVLLGCLDLNSSDFVNICGILEKIAFAYIITGSKTNELEKPFCEISKKARKADDTLKVQEVVDQLHAILEAKIELVKEALFKFKYTKKSDRYKVEYILHKMAHTLDGADFSRYTIEHIMPETKTKDWQNCPKDPEEYRDLISRLGNLTLISKGDNAAVKNKPFYQKKEIYKNQSSRLTKSLSEKLKTGTHKTKFDKAIKAFDYKQVPKKWDEKEIIRRTENMVKLALYIWFE